ncbi:MAG: elongation factor P [Chlamydiota bacterium]
MAYISTSDAKAGCKIEIEAQPYTVVSNEFCKPGKGQAFNRIRVKHLTTGRVIEKTFKSGEKVEVADVSESTMRLLYTEPEAVIFMDETSFEQISIPLSNLGDVTQWLLDDQLYSIIFYKGVPVSVEPPTFMDLVITDTATGIRGDTSGRVMKAATVNTGAKVQIPIFIEQGDVVKFDTRTGEYVNRVSK